MSRKPGKGQVINHSKISLLVIENDSGRPIVHILGGKGKSSVGIDVDGFRRADGKSIFLHKSWWKILNFTTADLWQLGEDLLVPTSLAFPVSDEHFGKYKLDKLEGWGQELAYVTGTIRNRHGKVIGYRADKYGRLSKSQAIELSKAGNIDNVVIVRNSRGTVFLRTKKNAETIDNLTV